MDNAARIEIIERRLQKRVGCSQNDIQVVFSPLRISPLGAHVDHQDGLVTGMTLDRCILFAFVPRADGHIRVESANFPDAVEFDLDDVPPRRFGDWGNYLRGAVLALRQDHTLKTGFDGLVEGDMPIGGLSSSAAVGVAYLLALEAANGLDMDIYPKSCTSRYCVKLTSSGKCAIIGIAQRRQRWQSDTRRNSSSKWSPSY